MRARLRDRELLKTVAMALAFAVLAAAVTLANSRGYYLVDLRFRFFWNPESSLAGIDRLWDGSLSMGRPGGDLHIAPGLALDLFARLGAPPWVAERLWHALLLWTAGVGAATFLRLFRPRLGLEHVLFGLFFMFNPTTTVFLVPSPLFVNYALTPWLHVTVVRGVRGPASVRWAAVFALLVTIAATSELVGLIFALVTLVPTALYLVLVERAITPSRLARWLAGTALLTLLVAAAVLVYTFSSSAAMGQQVALTEDVDTVSLNTSWTESFRGLGLWLTYFQFGDLGRMNQHVLLTAPVVIAATFLPLVVAVTALWRSSWRPRILFGTLLLVGATIMVGPFPIWDPPPAGAFLRDAYEDAPATTALRTTFKAAPVLALGVGALFAVGVRGVARRFPLRSPARAVSVAVAVAVVIASSLPFWTGDLYTEQRRLGAVPSYWTEALDWLNGQPDLGRALVLPPTSSTRYRWGNAGDDIFQAFLERPSLRATPFDESPAVTQDIVLAVARGLDDGAYEQGSLGPVARRLGVEWVILRNDLDHGTLKVPRPSQYDRLRSDPDLELVETFGPLGFNTTDLSDRSDDAARELNFAPVEIYRVRDASREQTLVAADAAALVVSGSGEAWLPLAAKGFLDAGGPLVYSAQAEDVGGLLRRGAPLVITDTNTRVVRTASAQTFSDSRVLTEGEALDREARSLFDRPGSQTLTWYADASMVTAPGSSNTSVQGRPGLALDGDRDTAWLTGIFDRDEDVPLRIDLREPEEVSEVRIQAARDGGFVRAPSSATIRFSDGSSEAVDFDRQGVGLARFEPRTTDVIEVRPGPVEDEEALATGLAEVEVPGLDLRETLQAPDDALRSVGAEELASSRPTYLFERRLERGLPQESRIRRRFRSPGSGPMVVEGTLALSPFESDELVDATLGSEVGAWGTSRASVGTTGHGGFAVDGDLEAGWLADPAVGEQLEVHQPETVVTGLVVVAAADDDVSDLGSVEVTIGDQQRTVPLEATQDCRRTRAEGCVAVGRVTVEPTRVDGYTVELTDVDLRTNDDENDLPVELLEVTAEGQPTDAGEVDDRPACRDDLVTIDDRAVPVMVDEQEAGLLFGEEIPFRSCGPVELDAGWHRVDGLARGIILRPEDDRFDARLGGSGTPADQATVAAEVRRYADGDLDLDVDVPSEGVLVSNGQSYDPGWRAFVDGEDLGAPTPANGQNVWRLTDPGRHRVETRYGPERRYRIALWISAAATAFCALAILWPRRRGRRTSA